VRFHFEPHNSKFTFNPLSKSSSLSKSNNWRSRVDLLEQAQDAMARHSWTEAFEMLTEVDATAGLGPEALEILGDAFW
jgi:hypothetical protein